MDKERIVRGNLSVDLVKHFLDQGMTMQQIANLIGVSESFISRVANKQRSFTIEHLLKFENATQEPLPLLLLGALSEESAPKTLRPLYKAVRDVLLSGGKMKRFSKRHRSPASVRRYKLATTK